MENRHLANVLYLNERKEGTVLQFLLAKCLSEILSIFIEANDASVHVNEHSNYRAIAKEIILRLSGHNPTLFGLFLNANIIVLLPLLVVENVSCVEVQAPNILLSGEILVDQKVVTADTNAYLRIDPSLNMDFINSVLEVKLSPLILYGNSLPHLLFIFIGHLFDYRISVRYSSP